MLSKKNVYPLLLLLCCSCSDQRALKTQVARLQIQADSLTLEITQWKNNAEKQKALVKHLQEKLIACELEKEESN